jgi:phage regulator Rha-like protein
MAKSKPAQSASSTVPALVPEQVDRSILVIRGHRVLLDAQLAAFYGVPTKALMQAVKRNAARFPDDFMFQLTGEEWDALRSQNAISNLRSQPVTSNLRSQSVTLKSNERGGRRYAPYAFTEQGVAMLSGLLRSDRAIDINIQIMRAFVRLRHLLSAHKELADRLAKLEQAMRDRDQTVQQQFQRVFALLDQLFSPPQPPRQPIGFHTEVKTRKAKS